jgi:hypothetical protein
VRGLKTKRRYIIASIAFAVLAADWQFGLGPRWTMRLPRDAVLATKYVGTQTNADPATSVVPKDDALGSSERRIRVTNAADWPRSVVLEDKYTVWDIQTHAVVFEYATSERVDPRTGAWSEGPHKGDIVVFPRDARKRTYTMRSNYMAGVPLKFSEEDDIDGLDTYQFTYRGPLDFTAAFAGTAQFPGIKIPAGKEIRCADDQFYYRIWVEPLTGEQVKVEKGCMSGDFIYDKATGKKVAAVDRWNSETTGAGLAARVTEVYDARRRYTWEALYIPGILIAGSMGILAAGFWHRNESALA